MNWTRDHTLALLRNVLAGAIYFGEQTRNVAFWSMLAAFGMVAYQVGGNRESPFWLLDSQRVVVRAGSMVMMDLRVWRDHTRKCAVTFSRTLIDARGAQHEITPPTYRSAESIAKMDAASPGRARFPMEVPPIWKGEENSPGVAPGDADLVIELAYSCNQAQSVLAPIRTRAVVKVFIEP